MQIILDRNMDPQTLIAALMGNGGAANMQPSAPGNYQQQMGDMMNTLQPSAVANQPNPNLFTPQQLGYAKPGMFGPTNATGQ